MKNATKGLLLGLGILIWFIASFIGLIYYTSSMNEEIGTVVIVGQYFFVFGLFILSVFKEKIAILFILVGTVIMIGAGINLYGTENIVYLFNEKGIPILGGMAFCLVGIVFICIPWYSKNKKKGKCTWETDAECYTLRKHDHTYSPVWKYYYNGVEYTYCDGIYNSVGIPEVGEFTKLYLDPDNPKEAYVPMNSIVYKGTIFTGSVFLFCGFIVIYSILR